MFSQSKSKPVISNGIHCNSVMFWPAVQYGSKLDKHTLLNNSNVSKHHFSNMPVYASMPALQAKLLVNTPGDKYEKEADAVADKIIQGNSALDNKPLSANISAVIQTKAQATTTGSVALSNKIFSSQQNGTPMDGTIQSFMQDRMGADFSKVKIHADNDAVKMNTALNSRAFTVGNNVYFNSGEYKPGTENGKRLLAHELVHTIQQGDKGMQIQKEDKDSPKAEKAEIDFNVLPPEFKLRIHHLLFEADTSQVHFDYQLKGLKAGLSYKYGGPLSLKLGHGDKAVSAGWTPGENKFTAGLSMGKFSAGLSATPDQNKFGVGLHFGDRLLPMQDDMSKTFTAGGMAGGNILSGLAQGPGDPLAFYQQHKADIDDVSKSVDLFKQITDDGKKNIRFGADLSATYDPVNKLVITGRLGMKYIF